MHINTHTIIFITLILMGISGWPGCKSIHTEIAIQASPREVWEVISANDRYPEWNPYHVRVDGELVEGSTLDVKIHKPNGNRVEIQPQVITVTPEKELTWGGGIPGLFTGTHVFEIVQREKDVLFIQREQFRGLFVWFAELDSIEEGYDLMNRALKARAENSTIP